jgi:hypothetical protein
LLSGVSFTETDFDLVGENIVPVVQLRHILERLPPPLQVSLLKIDAQVRKLMIWGVSGFRFWFR